MYASWLKYKTGCVQHYFFIFGHKFALHVDIFVMLEKNWLVHVSAIEDPTCVPFHAIFICRLEMQKKNCAYDDM